MIEHPSRRDLLVGAAAFSAWASIPKTAVAAGGRDPRFVTIILRGGLDGLAALAPIGDPVYEEVRDQFAMPEEGRFSGVPLNDFFMLNPRLPTMAELYRKGEALFVHAVHSPYRERSHFEGQDVLENGTTSDSHHTDGWLGRAMASLPVDSRIRQTGSFAAASSTPLLMRGSKDVVTWLPPGMPTASDDTRMRLMSVYEHTDPVLANALASGLELEDIAGSETEIAEEVKSNMMAMNNVPGSRHVVAAATAAGRAMAEDDGARIGFGPA
ncbi:MAG: hypothetical protein AAF615_06565, partial [Pseudomonadota bacterium]